TLDEVYIARVDVHRRQIEVGPLVADIGHFDDGVSERLEGEREIPVLRIRNMPAVGPGGGETGDGYAVWEEQSSRRNVQRLFERDSGKSRRVPRHPHRLGRVAGAV